MEVLVMPVIKEEVFLNCTPEIAFNEISSIEFLRKITVGSTMDNDVIFQNSRIIRYNLRSNYNNNPVSLEQERIIIPENLTIITQRKNIPFIKYALDLYIFKKHKSGTIMTFIEDFEKADGVIDNEALDNNKKRNKLFVDKIVSYFNKLKLQPN
jgi:hypothetical protein